MSDDLTDHPLYAHICTTEDCCEEQDYSESQPDGFPDGEGEDPCICFEPPGLVNPDPDCKTHRVDDRDRLNTRYAAIREAAQWAYQILDTYPVANNPVGRAVGDIKYKLRWVAKTGQGMEDIT